MADQSFLALSRLRVLRNAHVVYDQAFHRGVNIIRGENGSGKSTIADFIFYILGGEFDDWKDAAGRCTEVQAEIETARGKLSLRRDIGKKLTPIRVFFGPFDQAQEHALEGWETFPIRRQEARESFSQVMFRSMTIPEAQSEGASNITMHQLLRLLYSDQRTPATRLFRFESFDTQNIREAVGDLVCGVSGYEMYEANLSLRDLQNDFDDISRRLSALISALPSEEKLNSPEVIRSRLRELAIERTSVSEEIENADQLIDPTKAKEFLKERRDAYEELQGVKKKVSDLEFSIQKNELELAELNQFLEFLLELVEKITLDEQTEAAIGGIEFTHCPACLKPLLPPDSVHQCAVCGSETDPENDKSRYNQIRLDLEIQIRESRQLIEGKSIARAKEASELRRFNREYAQELSEFSIRYDLSSSPREAFLATKNQRLGQIEREAEYLESSLETAEEIQRLSSRKAELQAEIQTLKDRLEALNMQAQKRRRTAFTNISDYAAMLLKSDLDRQAEFMNAQSVTLDFRDDAIFVDGKMNFAESSNVYLKNSAIFGLFLAAGHDQKFFHPRFLLLDNIEDKGMEVERSHLFQRLVVEHATEIKIPYQVIYTTSMMNPDLELDDYTIGPHYNHEKRSLNLLS
jgi:uncharacterized Zn finger protein (UPF0148 family)